jgi:hypothetical protein
MAKIPAVDKGNLLDRLVEKAQVKADFAENNGGECQQYIQEPRPNYNKPTDFEHDIAGGKFNNFIIIGRDRPRDPCSGYGGKGDTQSACIDIIAGMTGRFARTHDKKGQKLLTNKSPELDAARIYISQRTDVDKNFNLPAGSIGKLNTRSAIAMKADGVRIIGREGIKLVTGTDTYNSACMKVDGIMGIDLIAGNDDEDLQPLVKGDNLKFALREIIELIADLNGIMVTQLSNYTKMLNMISVHTHVSTAPGNPTSPSLDLATACLNEFLFKVTPLMTDLVDHQKNCVSTEQMFLWDWGEGHILSDYNNTN